MKVVTHNKHYLKEEDIIDQEESLLIRKMKYY